MLAGIPPIEIVADEHRRVYSATCRVKPKSAKALWVRHEERQVTLRKWKERLSESSKGEWTVNGRNCFPKALKESGPVC